MNAVLEAIAQRALEMVTAGQIVGLGSGRAAAAFVRALGKRVGEGLSIRGIPTSESTAAIAREHRIPLVGLDAAEAIDITIDGADEVDPQLNLIKGYGHALVREKIVAAASKRLVILVGEEKLVPVLGARGILPVEIVPFAAPFCIRRLTGLGCAPQLRLDGERPKVSDNGNYILDCGIAPLRSPAELDESIRAIPGVVGTGLFLGMAERVLVGEGGGVRELTRR
ncbi:MAG TPA: ribose-5-phosphate isomerase RpiA [Terriglobales bacterium]|nr:ribose-5-phosphate isomerase RpiA [Terriglobales bacterium]